MRYWQIHKLSVSDVPSSSSNAGIRQNGLTLFRFSGELHGSTQTNDSGELRDSSAVATTTREKGDVSLR